MTTPHHHAGVAGTISRSHRGWGHPPPADLPPPMGDTDEARALATELFARWYHNPVRFCHDVFGPWTDENGVQHQGITLWRAQRRILRRLARAQARGRPVRIGVKSGQKTGKTTTIAVIALWWWLTRRNARVIMTAPTARQIRDVLWSEVRRLWGLAAKKLAAIGGLGGRLHEVPQSGLKAIDDSEGTKSEVIGFTARDPEGIAGLSGENLLWLVDEASGVPNKIFEAIDGNRAGDASIVLFSNPTRTSGEFFDAFHSKARFYARFTINSEDTPNARSGRKVIPGLATLRHVNEKRQEYGPDYTNDTRYRVRVLGEFPLLSAQQIISMADLRAAKSVWYRHAAQVLGRLDQLGDESTWPIIIRNAIELNRVRERWYWPDNPGPLRIGVDPAHYGDDLSAVFVRRGLRMFPAVTLSKFDGPALANLVLEIVARFRLGPAERPLVSIDMLGVGASAFDALKHSREVKVFGVNSGKAPLGEGAADEFLNLRAQVLWGARAWIRAGGGFEPDDELEKDLLATSYWLDGVGRIEAEKKKNVKARIGRSPDRGDGFSLATFEGSGAEHIPIVKPTMTTKLRFADQPGKGY